MKLERQREHHVTRDGIIPSFGSALSIDGINLDSCSNLEIFEDIKACDFQYGTELQYTIPWMKVGIQTDLTMFTRKGYNSNEMNTDDLVWNAMLTRTFCNEKRKRCCLSMEREKPAANLASQLPFTLSFI